MTDDLKAWISGSHFIGTDGLPQRWYHGTDVTDPFNIFAYCDDASLGFHFGTAAAANDRLSQISVDDEDLAGNVIPVYCRASNPLVLDDLHTWAQWPVASALCDCGILTEDEADFVAESASAEMIYAALEEAGHDCIIYRNVCEARDDDDMSLMVWRAELVKGVHSASFGKADPRILSQLPVSDDDRLWHASRTDEIERCREELRGYRQQSGMAPR